MYDCVWFDNLPCRNPVVRKAMKKTEIEQIRNNNQSPLI